MRDEVYTVRETAIANMEKIGKDFGTAWVKSHLLSPLLSLSKDKSYIQRLTFLSAIRKFTPICSQESIEGVVVPAVKALLSDPVPNVRFKSAQTMRVLIGCVGKSEMKRDMKKSIEKLTADKDKDVKYFAQKALEGL